MRVLNGKVRRLTSTLALMQIENSPNKNNIEILCGVKDQVMIWQQSFGIFTFHRKTSIAISMISHKLKLQTVYASFFTE